MHYFIPLDDETFTFFALNVKKSVKDVRVWNNSLLDTYNLYSTADLLIPVTYGREELRHMKPLPPPS